MILRKKWMLAAAATLCLAAASAHAQPEERTLREGLRACSQIADVPDRVACYDALAAAGADGAETSAQPAGFGSSQVPRARVPETRPAEATEPDSIVAEVAAIVQREPGIYLLTLSDGAQWLFVDGVPRTYGPPRGGSKVEIRRASMGSYLLRFQDQPAVRVRRVR